MYVDTLMFPNLHLWASDLVSRITEKALNHRLHDIEVSVAYEWLNYESDPCLIVRLYVFPNGLPNTFVDAEDVEMACSVFSLEYSMEFLNSLTKQKMDELFTQDLDDMFQQVFENMEGTPHAQLN